MTDTTNVPALKTAPLIPLELVEWKVDSKPIERDGQVPKARFVPYIDARDVARLLDEWVGPANWSDAQHGGAYDEASVAGDAGMWCSIAVWDPRSGEWLVKTDFGRPSNVESGKGLVSDAFKRCACVKWGCGRNVYDLPNVWAPVRVTTKTGKDGKDAKQAWPIAATLPSILEQLHAMGFEASGGRVIVVDESVQVHDDETVSPHADRAPSSGSRSPAQSRNRTRSSRVPDDPAKAKGKGTEPRTLKDHRAQLEERLNGLEPDAHRATCLATFVKAFGAPGDVKAGDIQRARLLVDGFERSQPTAAPRPPREDPPADTPATEEDAAGEPPKQSEADRVHVHHLGKVALDVAALDARELDADLEACGVTPADQPTNLADAYELLKEKYAEVLDSKYPAGATDDEYAAWWFGEPDEE